MYNDLMEHHDNQVADFLKKINFQRTFPLDIIVLAEKMGGWKIFYMAENSSFFNRAEAAINTEDQILLLHPRFDNGTKESYLSGRYILCKAIAHIALNHIPSSKGWIEPKKEFRDKIDEELNPSTAAFAYELLLPKNEFLEQWQKLGENVSLLSKYFGASQQHIVERKNFLLGK